ncbi:MAG TPA: potassium transporter TrkG [Clostridia bacterium]
MKDIENKTFYKKRFSPLLIIVLGYFTAIFWGAFLILLPISNADGQWLNILDALFTATSAICTTGLSTVNVTLTFSLFGQIVILILIQIGGLGIMGLASMLFLTIRKKLTLSNRLIIQQTVGEMPSYKIASYLRYMLAATLIIEFLGAVALMPAFIKTYGAIGVFKAFFISISAFCNAGLDVLSYQEASLIGFSANVSVILSVGFLIILGGIGFWVIMDIAKAKKFNRLMLHTKIVLIATAVLIGGGAIIYLIAEWNNPLTLGGMNVGQKILNAFFMAITPRTAGFNNVELNNMTEFSKLFTMLLMFIGASPASTGGGIKTTTAAVLLLIIISGFKSKDRVIVNKRYINTRITLKAAAVAGAFCILTILITMALLITENGLNQNLYNLETILFESISALDTVGLSLGITPHLSIGGKIIIMLAMFIGRLGPLTVGLLFLKNIKAEDKLRYPEAMVMIG